MLRAASCGEIELESWNEWTVTSAVKNFSNAWRKPAVLADRGTTGWRHVLEANVAFQEDPLLTPSPIGVVETTRSIGQPANSANRIHPLSRPSPSRDFSTIGVSACRRRFLDRFDQRVNLIRRERPSTVIGG